jgi:HSP20 family molecular chaperone IbpA
MAKDDPRDWMWSEALQMIARAERLHREVFAPPQISPRGINWLPPTDVFETDDAVLIYVALPGVDIEKVEIAIHNSGLILAGERPLPPEARTGIIHRLELPQGRFERHVPLPAGRYEKPRTALANGCLLIKLTKVPAPRGRP